MIKPGTKHRNWTVLRSAGTRTWFCRCDCGVEKIVGSRHLLYNRTTRCISCAGNELIDLTGQRFGKWVVLRRAPLRSPSQVPTGWLCRCDCGTERAINSQHLRRGHTTGCQGCTRVPTEERICQWCGHEIDKDKGSKNPKGCSACLRTKERNKAYPCGKPIYLMPRINQDKFEHLCDQCQPWPRPCDCDNHRRRPRAHRPDCQLLVGRIPSGDQ